MIYLLEDDDSIRDLVLYTLQSQGMEAKGFPRPSAFWEAMAERIPSLVLLDIMLPELSGLEVIRRLRRESQIPVIMLTARDTVVDKVSGLDSGADDYITKPFAIEELLARIRVALKKHRADTAQSTGARSAGKLHMEPASYSAGYGDEAISLTKKEFDLLNYLWQHENNAVTRDDLLTNVWGYEFTGDTNIVDVYIRYLRQKIDDRFGIKTIHTIRAVGYMFRYEQE